MRSIQSLLLVATVSAVNCAQSPDLDETAHEVACPSIDEHALIENDPALVNDARFSLERVLTEIQLTTPAHVARSSTRAMFDQLYADYAACGSGALDPHGYGLTCRPDEAQLAALDPFTADPEGLHFKPVALVNRLDLAGATYASCGESRIVYWMDHGPVTGKAGIIVEMSTPPVHTNGKRTCAPIARFWAQVAAEPDADKRAAMLEHFYFEGLPGMPYAPVSARGVGWAGKGQVRLNSFVGNAQWNLRELKYQKVCSPHATCEARFVSVDTKNNPSQLLFSGAHPWAPGFQTWFVDTAVPKLAAATTVNDLSLGNAPRFDTWESISQPRPGDPTSVVYADSASAALRQRIADRLASLGSALTPDDILHRATAATCAGCHRVSKLANLGGGMTFPAASFAHVGADGQPSQAMVDEFLPHRRELVQAMACEGSPQHGEHEADDAETIDGKSIDDPN